MYRPPPTSAGGGLLCLQLYDVLSAFLLAPIMEGLENLSAQYSQRPEEWVPEAATFETAKSYREKKAMPLIQKLVKVLFALHRKYWEVKNERNKYQNFYQDEKKATHHLSQRLKEVEAENSQFYAMKRDF